MDAQILVGIGAIRKQNNDEMPAPAARWNFDPVLAGTRSKSHYSRFRFKVQHARVGSRIGQGNGNAIVDAAKAEKRCLADFEGDDANGAVAEGGGHAGRVN